MGKTLNFTHDGKKYALEFTRSTVIDTERAGFRLEQAWETPVTSLTLLWNHAFDANHPDTPYAVRDEIFSKISQRKKDAEKDDTSASLMNALIGLYTAPIESLVDEEHEKNAIEWTVT